MEDNDFNPNPFQKTLGFTTYDAFNSRIIEIMEQGIIPWKKTWKSQSIFPRSIYGRPYNGVNVWILAFGAELYGSPYFITWKQCKKMGGYVKKEESTKGFPVTFWCEISKKDPETGEEKKSFILRYYNVFNINQCKNLPFEKFEIKIVENNFPPQEDIDSIIMKNMMDLNIEHNHEKAFYLPSEDKVYLPNIGRFDNSDFYYLTKFHEFVHATGHKNRLNRSGVQKPTFGSKEYSKEELIAELGASYLACYFGIDNTTIENSAAYLQDWLKVLKNDRTMIVKASSKAQKAVEFIIPEFLKHFETKTDINKKEINGEEN